MSWDIPVNDHFVQNIRRGVRRRRLLRRAVAGAAVLLAAGGGVVAVRAVHDPGPAVVAPAIGEVLDGFQITWLPDGTTRTGGDSIFRRGLNDEDTGPGFSAASRRFDRGVGIGLFVCVMRPEPGVTTDQVAHWAAGAAQPVRTFAVPAGDAELLANVGSETTTYTAVITTPGGVVITVEANGAFRAAEVESVARGITP
ncbi:hypothetical protein BJ973_005260 [Actinoplanes tereljensis]|uniref:Uncharacterized protein n=1 Tax=Paractinoplanes tereljensis TaxID=571912 RepID=A0A919NMM4_9ACTN|nr:hypothetical protein [Actinoplanes tereljensis]GIF21293.1 hypothetical protein Ate02nite_40230 [Actinoplanes tereljensis]